MRVWPSEASDARRLARSTGYSGTLARRRSVASSRRTSVTTTGLGKPVSPSASSSFSTDGMSRSRRAVDFMIAKGERAYHRSLWSRVHIGPEPRAVSSEGRSVWRKRAYFASVRRGGGSCRAAASPYPHQRAARKAQLLRPIMEVRRAGRRQNYCPDAGCRYAGRR